MDVEAETLIKTVPLKLYIHSEAQFFLAHLDFR